MVSGLFLGGLSQGFQNQEKISNQADFQQKSLQIQQQEVQNQQQRDQNANFMKIRSDAVSHLDETMNALKVAHPDWGPMQLASNPAVVAMKQQIGTLDQNLKLPNTIDSIVASLAEKPSEAATAHSLAVATGSYGKTQAETAEAQARTGYLNRGGLPMTTPADPNNPDLDKDTQLGGPGQPAAATDKGKNILGSLAGRAQMTPDELDVMGRARAAGNAGVLQNLGRGKQGGEAVKAVNAWATYTLMHEGGLSAADAAQKLNDNTVQFNSTKVGSAAGARTAASREANLGIILDTAKSAIPSALQASDSVPRGTWVPVNKLVQTADSNLSDPNLLVFKQKNLQLAELWAKSMNPTGTMRESDRQLALNILGTANGPVAYKAVVGSIAQSIGMEKDAAISFLKDRGLGGIIPKSEGGDTKSDKSNSPPAGFVIQQ